MSRYQVLPPAESDIREIIRYVGADRPPAAADLRRKLKAAFERLAGQPGIGHPRNDLISHPDLRFWRVDRYLIAYKNDLTKGVKVLRVLHGSRDIASLLDDEPPVAG